MIEIQLHASPLIEINAKVRTCDHRHSEVIRPSQLFHLMTQRQSVAGINVITGSQSTRNNLKN